MQSYNSTRINEYFAYLENTVNPQSTLHKAVKLYMDEQRDIFNKKHDGPFLTIVTRTQGKRMEMLNEMILCLVGQSDTDFEFILTGHDLPKEVEEDVKALIDEQPAWLREKTTYLAVTGGTRTTPLIKAFDIAKGQYVAVLDDDDIVFDNWVEAFKETAKEDPGKIIHSYSVRQDWETVGKTQIPRCIDAPVNIYCKDFNYVKEFVVNVCPLMSLAFPIYAYKTLGIKFDEELTTTEDWDFLMRISSVTGVANNSAITSIYRFWKNTETSQTAHNKKEWDDNYKKIVNRLKKMPKVLSDKEFNDCVNIIAKGIRPAHLYEKVNVQDAELFYDDGNGFTAGRSLRGKGWDEDEKWDIFFDQFDKIGKISALRFDPQDMGGITVETIKIKVVFADGTEKEFNSENIVHNGYFVDDKIVFIKNDPQFIITVAEPKKVKRVCVQYTAQEHVPDEIINILLKPYEKKLVKTHKKNILKRRIKNLLKIGLWKR